MFQIDTGATEFSPLNFVDDYVLDALPEGHTEREAIHAQVFHLIGRMQAWDGPKKLETVRSHTRAKWAFLGWLSEHHPDLFDEFWRAYVERLDRQDNPLA